MKKTVRVGQLGILIGMAWAGVLKGQTTWKQTQEADAFRGTSYVQFALEGKFLTKPRLATLENPVMIVKCVPGQGHRGHTKGKFVTGYIATGAVVENRRVDGSRDDVSGVLHVQYRFDDGKIQYELLSRSMDFSAIFFKSPVVFGSGFEELGHFFYGHFGYHKAGTNPQVQKVVLDVPEYLGGEIVMEFDFPDVTQVADACGIIWYK